VQSKVQLGVALRSLGEVLAAGTAGGDDLTSARAHLLQSIMIFEEIGNDVELARSCHVYAELLRAAPDFEMAEVAVSKAEQVSRRGEKIFGKLKMSAHAPDADDGSGAPR